MTTKAAVAPSAAGTNNTLPGGVLAPYTVMACDGSSAPSPNDRVQFRFSHRASASKLGRSPADADEEVAAVAGGPGGPSGTANPAAGPGGDAHSPAGAASSPVKLVKTC
ncbi:hypothetical protein DIPPA_16361 [Diplonema papillatum]|nr:hypothetical protein DIPPA_16361 [Diplonema papillatum]